MHLTKLNNYFLTGLAGIGDSFLGSGCLILLIIFIIKFNNKKKDINTSNYFIFLF